MKLKASIFLLTTLTCLTCISSKSTEADSALNVKDILNLLPNDKIEDIEQDSLKNDEGFRAAVYYFQSKEWQDLVDDVLKKSEYQQFTKMAAKYNINVSQAISCIRKHIESLKVTEKPKAEPNLEPFIQKIQSVLPITEMAKVLTEKLHNAEAKNLRDNMSSKENQRIAEAVHNLPETIKMREILKGMKFDVEPYIALVYTFLGWVH